MTTSAPWIGTLTITAEQRRQLLRIDPAVTEALIDELLPTVEYIAYWRSFGARVIDTATRRQWADEARVQAQTVAQFRALLDDETHFYRVYFIGRWIERGVPSETAEQLFRDLKSDLDRLEAHHLDHADQVRPRTGPKPDTHIEHLVRAAADAWRRHTRQPTGTSETGPFSRFCFDLATLAGIELTREKIRRALDRWN